MGELKQDTNEASGCFLLKFSLNDNSKNAIPMITNRLSIIVPVYNVEQCLKKCLDSILAQTFTNWECILVDDGSTDNGGMICDVYAKNDHRFKVVHQDNQGLSVARRTGLQYANGEFIGWVDSDDWIGPDYFENLYNAITEKNVDVVSCNITEVENGQYKVTNQYCGEDNANAVLVAILRRKIRASVGNRIYRRSAIDRSGAQFFDRTLCPIMEDTQFHAQFYRANPRVAHIDSAGYYYLIREGSLSIQTDRVNWWKRANIANDTVYDLLKDWYDKDTIRYRKAMFKAMLYGEDLIPDEMFYKLYPEIRLAPKDSAPTRVRIEMFFATFGLRRTIFKIKSILKDSTLLGRKKWKKLMSIRAHS